MFVTEIDARAFHGVRAARLESTIGERMARAYAKKHGAMSYYILARCIERGSI